jgi:ABC-2 type transport system permease protein
MKVLSDTGHMTVRHLMALWRQPWWIAVSLVQPVIWLLLFGALFEAVTDIPGFGSTNYIQFLAPGVVVMTAFFGAGWAGMPVIEDIDRGVIERIDEAVAFAEAGAMPDQREVATQVYAPAPPVSGG